jgi:hypothetical protein
MDRGDDIAVRDDEEASSPAGERIVARNFDEGLREHGYAPTELLSTCTDFIDLVTRDLRQATERTGQVRRASAITAPDRISREHAVLSGLVLALGAWMTT